MDNRYMVLNVIIFTASRFRYKDWGEESRMIFKRIIRFVFLLLLSVSMISMVSGAWFSGIAYYQFEDNALDTGSEGNNEDLTQVNTPTYNTGLVGPKAIHFEKTSNQYVVNTAFLSSELEKVRSIDFWIKVNGSNVGSVLSIGDGTNVNRFEISTVNETHLDVFWLHNSVHQFSPSFQNFRFTTNNDWEQMIITFGAAGVKIYESGDTTPVFTNAATTTFDSDYDRISIGASSNNDNWLTATIDNFFMTEPIYTTTNVTDSYNSGAGCFFNLPTCAGAVPAIAFDNVTINDVQNFNNTFYNISPVTLKVNLSTVDTNNNTNVTFFLYNSTGNLINTTQFMTNTLNGQLDIGFPYEDTFRFFLNATNNDTNILSPIAPLTNYTIHFDETPPSLSVNLPTEYGFYDDFNFSNFINVSDLNLVSCIITISNETSTTCTNTSYSFQFNGNHTINIVATDTAGNTNTSLNNIMLINPLQNFFFQTGGGTPITNFTFGGTNFNTFANITTYGSLISLGSNTLLFERLGFSSTNVTFNVNLTSRINLTTNITNSTIVLRIFDRETLLLLTGLTTITLEATTGFNGTTTTGLLNITDINFINEQYQILAEHVGYSAETVFFNYNNQETIAIDIFMLNSTSPDAGTITLIVKNTLSQLVESAICSVLEWRPAESAFVSVAQGLTNVNGETIVNIELNTKIYEFSCTKQTFTTVTNAQIIQLDDSQLSIILNDIFLIPTTLFPNLVTSLVNSSINDTHQLVTYTFADSDGLTTEGCLQSFFVNGNRETFDQETCVSTPTGVLLLTVNINQTSDILMKGVLTTPDITDYVTNTLTFKGTGDISYQLARIGMDVLIPSIFILLGLGLGVILSNISVAMVLMAIGGWMAVAFVPTVMSSSIAMFISVIVGLAIWLGFDRK